MVFAPAAHILDPAAIAVPGNEVIPRWEWRVFVRGALNLARLATFLKDDTERTRAETYLISSRSLHSVKVHNVVVEVKRFERLASDGLQLWRPALRQEFPLSAKVLGLIFDAWGLDEALPYRPCWSERQMERDFIDPRSSLRAIPVLAQRTPLEVARCRGEHVALTVLGEHWETIGFDDPDPARVRTAAGAIGLGMLPNESYPAALAKIAGITQPEAVTSLR